MYWIVDILMLLFVGFLLYRGIKKGFMNTSFTLITCLLWIALAAGCSFGIMWLVFRPIGLMAELQQAFTGFTSDMLNLIGSFAGDIGIAAEDAALYLGYVVMGVILFIPLYIFFLWVGKKFEQLMTHIRTKNKTCKIIGSVLGGVVNFALAGVMVLGFFWFIGAVDGSGLFTFTNDAVRAAPISGLIYKYNPLCSLLGEHGFLAEQVGNILNGNFLMQ